MAITVTDGVGSRPVGAVPPGSRRHNVVKVVFDTSYPTGGYALTAAQCGLGVIDWVQVPGVSALGTHLCRWDPTNAKLLLFTAVGTEVANAVDVHTDSVTCVVWGD